MRSISKLDRAIAPPASASSPLLRHSATILLQECRKLNNRTADGTVGAVALDRSGTVAAGASTGGIDSMLPGRVGDSPLIGCGVYADNQSWCGVDDGHRRRHHPPCDRQEYLRSSGYGEEPCGRRSTGVPDARVSDPWVGWSLSPLAGRAICHQACDAPYGCGLVERDRPADRSRTISMKDALFHLAFPTHDVTAAKRFYVDGLGCTLGRESSHAVMFGLAGHQLVAHLTPELATFSTRDLSASFRVGPAFSRGMASLGRAGQSKGVDVLSAAPRAVPRHPHRTSHILSRRPLSTICSNSNTTRMSRRFSASENIVRSATRCNLPPVPGLWALPNVGLVLTLVLRLALTLALVLAGGIEKIPE